MINSGRRMMSPVVGPTGDRRGWGHAWGEQQRPFPNSRTPQGQSPANQPKTHASFQDPQSQAFNQSDMEVSGLKEELGRAQQASDQALAAMRQVYESNNSKSDGARTPRTSSVDESVERLARLTEKLAAEQLRRKRIEERASAQQDRLLRLEASLAGRGRPAGGEWTAERMSLRRSTSDAMQGGAVEGEVSSLRSLLGRLCRAADSAVNRLSSSDRRPVRDTDLTRLVEEHMRRLQNATEECLSERARRESTIESMKEVLADKDRQVEFLGAKLAETQQSLLRIDTEVRSLRLNESSRVNRAGDADLVAARTELSAKETEIAMLTEELAQTQVAAKAALRNSSSNGGSTDDHRDTDIKRLLDILRSHGISPETGRKSRASGAHSDAALQRRLEAAEAACRGMREEAKKEVLTVSMRHLRLTNLLGSGSFADVHEGVWDVRCAVKRLKDAVKSNPYEVQKFHREAQMLRSLRHPGILRLMGFSQTDFLLVMEIMTGGTLHDLVHNNARLEYPRVLGIGAEIADVLRYLHYCNIVHRDLKPENLMIDANGRLRLCDFGLAAEKRGKYVSTRSNLAGTPRYMAPESYRDEPCTEKIDIYSFGMIMWEIFTRSLPWAGRNFSEVRAVVSAGTERPPMPRDAPPDFARLIEDCWAHEPDNRPSAADVLHKLQTMGAPHQPFSMDDEDDYNVEAC